eukprot:TRINITY_DN27583_c0_g1_i1.p1 TRINITY_DN27583_c0_g1~~TRINITY_DN27583_c0_g1_i1.p1  ORF type:complete len:893 (-),score=56.32 TRINITY_DN27583_c0_g1_i1:62-2740(-)
MWRNGGISRAFRNWMRKNRSPTPGLPRKVDEQYHLHGQEIQDPFNYLAAFDGGCVDMIASERKFMEKMLFKDTMNQHAFKNWNRHLEHLRWKAICFTEEEVVSGYMYKTSVESAAACVITRQKITGGDYVPEVITAVEEGSLVTFRVSDDNRYIALVTAVPISKRRRVTDHLYNKLLVRDMVTGKVEEFFDQDVAGVEWTPDGRLLYMVTSLGRPYEVYEHQIDREWHKDKLLLSEEDDRYCLSLSRSKDKKWLFVSTTNAHRADTYVYLPMRKEEKFLQVTPNLEHCRFQLEHNRGTFYLLGSEAGSNYPDKIWTIPSKTLAGLAKTDKQDDVLQHATQIWQSDPQDPSIIIDMDMFAEWLAVYEYVCTSGQMRIRLIPTWQYRDVEALALARNNKTHQDKPKSFLVPRKEDEEGLPQSIALQQSPPPVVEEFEAQVQPGGRLYALAPGGTRVDTSKVPIYRAETPFRPPDQETVLVNLPEDMWVTPSGNGDFFARTIRFSISNLTTFPLLGAYNFATGEMTVTPPVPEVSQTSEPGAPISPFNHGLGVPQLASTLTVSQALMSRKHLDSENYKHARLWVPSKHTEGVHIPITMVYNQKRMEFNEDDKSWEPPPLFVVVYGAYGELLHTGFDAEYAALLEFGWNVAFVHVRGGGELGPAWHNSGKNLSKQNSIVDFLDCLYWLHDNNWARPETTAVFAHSAGAIVPATAWNMHGIACTTPDVLPEQDAEEWQRPPFHAQLLDSPFLDVTTIMRHPHLALVPHDFPEFGNPNKNEDEWTSLCSYSPYDTFVPDFAPPHTFIQVGQYDMKCPIWNALKYVAKSRYAIHTQKGGTPGAKRLFICDAEPQGNHRFTDVVETTRRMLFLHEVFGFLPDGYGDPPVWDDQLWGRGEV